ncbi:MAG: hypothetical protein ACTS73_07340 [Arsenophonus sp. NEOnobi-MAG3]
MMKGHGEIPVNKDGGEVQHICRQHAYSRESSALTAMTISCALPPLRMSS